MKTLFFTFLIVFFSMTISAQVNLYSDSKIKVQYTLENFTDEVNDNFYEYYSFEISNISQIDVLLTPIFKYITENGEQRSTANLDENQVIKLTPGETLKGKFEDYDNLTLFKQFLIGNSGKRAADIIYTIEAVTINYQ